ncbi:MAG: Eco57I restriction-modification methylase domain-containing protein [Cytophagaceae bacterium]|nr:Eco57I restriction-modification methylase domain-containing protein [Cytophagaceae bacterium]
MTLFIGNPPYIKEYTNKSAFDGIRDNAYYMGKMDIWYFFACFCIDMLKDNGGIQCFIAQNNWITSAGAAKLRNKIVQETEMLSFIDFGNYKVFQSAGIQTMIYVVKKTATPPTHYTTKYARLLVDNIDKTFLDYFLQSKITEQHENFEKLQFEFKKEVFTNSTISFNSSSNEKLLDIIELKSNFKILSEEIIQGIVGAPDKAFILNENQFQLLNESERKFVKKYYTGIDEISEKYIVYLSNKNFSKEELSDYPNLYEHFQPFKDDLIKAKIQYKTPNKPYFYLHRERDENFFLQGEKLVCQTRSPKFAFYYTIREYYASRALNILKTTRVDMQYLSALLNSKVMAFWYLKRGAMLGNLLKMDIGPLLNLPLIIPENVSIVKCLYQYILFIEKARVDLIKYISNEIVIYALKEVINQAFTRCILVMNQKCKS